MKNIQLSSLETDRKMLFASWVAACLASSALVGYFLAAQLGGVWLRLVGSIVGVALGVFVWGLFRLLQPARHGRAWTLGKTIGIPLVWLLLATALAFWIYHNNAAYWERWNDIITRFNRL
jgi:hypothetical protein